MEFSGIKFNNFLRVVHTSAENTVRWYVLENKPIFSVC